MYRAFTFLTLEAGHDPASRPRMKQLLEKVDFHAEIQNREITLREANRDLVPHTRLPEVNAAVSIVSTLPELREHLVNLQRKLRLSAPLVMEGRDIGTVVCSDSPFKYFIDACPTVRAERRRKQGEKDNLAARDKIDSSRSRMKQLLEKVDFHAEIQNREITLREANRDLGSHTRLPEVNAAVSIVSTLPELREYLVNLQRKLRLSAPLVMEGRDIGTVVCSDSPFKYFIDACPTVRAERRRKQGEKDNLAARDKIDSSRSAAPLLRAADATLLDSGKNDARSLADQIVQEVRARQKPGPTVP